MLKSIFDIRSKTFWFMVLAIILILVDAVGKYPGPPEIALTIAQIITFLLVGFGLFDAAKQEEKALIEKVTAYIKTQPAVGIAIEALAHLTETIPGMENVPSGLVLVAKILGAIFIIMGFRKEVATARLNDTPTSERILEKYQKVVHAGKN